VPEDCAFIMAVKETITCASEDSSRQDIGSLFTPISTRGTRERCSEEQAPE
jgi:hypothetical protein